MSKTLKRSSDKIIAGVCGGVADYFGLDATLLRVLFALFGFFGAGVLVYIILWIVMPSR